MGAIDMLKAHRGMVVGALLVAAANVQAEIQLDASLAAFADESSGRSLDLDVGFSPARWVRLSGGFGTSESSEESADLSGDGYRLALDVSLANAGLRGYTRTWDADDFAADTLGVNVYLRHEGFEFAFIGEQKEFDVGFDVLVLGRPVSRTESFEGRGYGVSMSWCGTRWGYYFRALDYNYDDRFDGLLLASRSPTTSRFPRFAALVSSILTRTQGALDYQASIGFERFFSRSSVRVDYSQLRDAVFSDDGSSYGIGYRFGLTRSFDLDLSAGIDESEDLDAVGFAGLTLLYRY
jgi:hypothetical protein